MEETVDPYALQFARSRAHFHESQELVEEPAGACGLALRVHVDGLDSGAVGTETVGGHPGTRRVFRHVLLEGFSDLMEAEERRRRGRDGGGESKRQGAEDVRRENIATCYLHRTNAVKKVVELSLRFYVYTFSSWNCNIMVVEVDLQHAAQHFSL